MSTLVEYPGRSPIAIADALAVIIKDKVVCDIGCAAGDLMVAFSKYASHVKGIERNTGPGNRNGRPDHFDIIEEEVSKDNMPDADVYYVWVAPGQVQRIMSMIPDGKTIVLGDYDDSPHLKYPIEGGVTIRYPFNERGREEWWRLTIIKK